jgi:DNA-binding MarR family transcriptional regulator
MPKPAGQYPQDLLILEAVAENQLITQRGLARKLGIALGLANLYMRRLVRKGYIKCANVRANRIRYLLTPKGVAERARLTYEFMEYSLELYRKAREHLSEVLQEYSVGSRKGVAIFGSGEAAELAYLTLREHGLEPAAIFDHRGGGFFLGEPVRDIREHSRVRYEIMIVATLKQSDELVGQLRDLGIPASLLATLTGSGRVVSNRPLRPRP